MNGGTNTVRRDRAVERAVLLLAAPALLALAGCVELDVHIKVNADESVVVTETVTFSEQVLDLASTLPSGEGLEGLLNKERSEERVKQMGEGCTLVSHKVENLPGGARQCVTVYRIADLNKLRVCSPALLVRGHERSHMGFRFYPQYEGSWNVVGWCMLTRLHTPSPDRKSSRDPYWQARPPALTPAEMQKYRELLPVLADLMDDLKLTMTIEYWHPIARGVSREARSLPTRIYIMKYDETNLDHWGGRILDNEEFMLALMRWDLDSPHVTSVVRHFGSNLAIPVWNKGRGTSGTGWHGQIAVKPSKQMHDKYYKNRPKPKPKPK